VISLGVSCRGFPVRRFAYVRQFELVEIQQTFYLPPRSETLRRWRAEAPPGFEFALKAWKLITHRPTSPTYRRLRKPIPEQEHARYGAFRGTAEVQAAWQTHEATQIPLEFSVAQPRLNPVRNTPPFQAVERPED
jgi:uncharacterized protein YecE (DUF72 family)